VSGRIRAAGDHGSGTIWVLAGSTVLLLLALVLALRTTVAVARHRVESSADLAALAAAGRIGFVADGAAACAAADPIARANGGSLLDCQVTLQPDGRTGTVAVRVGTRVGLPVVGSVLVTASARAGRAESGRGP
jgi:secretion/DNA translocation related TadE-like protein